MNGTSSGSGLQARLQKRAEQDRQEIEALTQSELKKLAGNLRQSVNDEMYIIVRDIKDHTRWMNAALWGAWLRSVVVGVCLFLGICVGSWGLTRWYANQIQSLIETRAALEIEIQEARQTIERIEQTTWGRENSSRSTGGATRSCRRAPQKTRSGSWTTGLPSGYRASEGAI